MSEADEEKHEVSAIARVVAQTGVNQAGELEAREQEDFKVTEWVCSCDKSWDADEREEARKHLEANQNG